MMTTTDPSNSHSRATPRVVRDCTLDWVKIDTTVMRDPSLSPAAKSLYGILATFADRDTRVSTDDPDGFDVPTRRSLAYCMGKSVDTIDRLTAELEAYRLDGHPLLIVERRSDPRNPKLNLPSVYHLLDHEHWDARAAERHAARGGRKSAARGGRTDAAVPTTTQKNTTHRAHEGASESDGAVVPEPGGGSQSDADMRALRDVLRSHAYEALTLGERGSLAAVVQRLIGDGWTTDTIRARRPDRRVNENTTRPHTHISQALDTLAAESAPSTTPTSSASRTAIDDCGRCDPSGWATVDDGTPDGAVVRCPHDGSIPAEPASEADPAAADQAQLVLVSTFGLSVLSRCLTHPGQPRWS